MEFEERRKNLGTIYFPISLLILVILSFSGVLPLYAAGTGILVMGYGDGLASLFGEQYGKWNFPIWDSRKSYVGTSVMFTATAAVVISMTLLFGPSFRFLELAAVAFVIAAVSTFIELITPWGLDNITVPIGTAFLYTLIAV
jgi:phytol kinase